MNKPRGRTKKSRARNGQGTRYQRQDGSWLVQLTQPDGKRKSYSARTKEEADQILEEERHKLYQGVPTSDTRLSMRDFLEEWLKDIKGSVRASTWERYEDYVRLYITPEVGNIQLRQLSPSDVQALCNRASKKVSARTVHHLRTVLHTALGHAIAQRRIIYNAAEKIKLPKVEQKEMQTFSQEEVIRFFEAIAGDRLEALYVLAIWTGMRQGELLALRWRDIDLDARVLSVNRSLRYRHQEFTYQSPKTEKGHRQIKIAPDAVEALRRHQERQMFEKKQLGEHWQGVGEHQDLIFTNHFGGPMDASNLLKYCFHPVLKKAGLDEKGMRFHDLRHTFATLQLKAKTPAKTVSTMLGHSTIAITLDTYTHVDLEEQDEALGAMARGLSSVLGSNCSEIAAKKRLAA